MRLVGDAVVTAPWPPHPGLDAATVLQLRTHGFVYISTRWNAYFGEWQHRIDLVTPRGVRQLVKTDAGIAALLEVPA